MGNSNHVFVGLPALIKNAAASDPVVSAGDNHISGIGFFDAITGGTVNRDDLSINFRNTNFLAAVGSQVYFYVGTGVGNVDWTNSANWREITTSSLTQVISDLAQEVTDRTNADSSLTSGLNANTAAIGTNTNNISTNTTDIATNAASINTNATGIASNLSAIQSNDTDITTLQGSVSTNTNNIAINSGDIATNASSIATNTSAISSNNTDIATNATAIAAITSASGSINTHGDVDTVSTSPEIGHVLFWDGSNWIPEYSEVLIEVKNSTSIDFTKGDAVYVSGTHASGKPLVDLADNNGAQTYPSIGLLYEDLNAGDEGLVVISGSVFGLDTSSYSAGDALYLDSTAGALTNTRPSGHTKVVQKVALVKRSHSSAGSVIIMGAGRVNDVPNLQVGFFWRGSSTGVAQAADFETSVANTTAVSTNTTKLSSIENGATADQTGAEIKSLYEVEVNAFTDAQFTKLSGIQTGATANSTDATLLNRANHTGTQTASTISDFDTEVSNNAAVTANTAKVSADGLVTTHSDVTNAGSGQIITDAERTKLTGIESGATSDQTGAEIKAAYEAEANTNAFTDAEQTKLAGIAANAEVNVQANWAESNSASDAFIQNKPSINQVNNSYARMEMGSSYLAGGANQFTFNNPALVKVIGFNAVQTVGSAITADATNNRFEVSSAGLYTFTVNGYFQSLVHQRPTPTLSFYVNGVQQSGRGHAYVRNATNAQTASSNLTRTFELAAGDRVEVYAQNTGHVGTAMTYALDFVVECLSQELKVNDVIQELNGQNVELITRNTAHGNGTYEGEIVKWGNDSIQTLKWYNYTSSGWRPTDASAVSSTEGLVGVALGTSSTTNGLLVKGIHSSNAYISFSAGDVLYLTTTTGVVSATAPSTSGQYIRVVGYILNPGLAYINPSSTYVAV